MKNKEQPSALIVDPSGPFSPQWRLDYNDGAAEATLNMAHAGASKLEAFAVHILAAGIAGKPSAVLGHGLSPASLQVTETGRMQVAFAIMFAQELLDQLAARAKKQTAGEGKPESPDNDGPGIDLSVSDYDT